ncbi:MAG: V-type ATP synthase subunit D [Aminivibrio sp.]|jgi:V/A-type H+-transporting ATPase subunit D
MNARPSGPPTREHLLNTRRRIESVSHGKKLLERKRDALVRAMDEERRLFRETEKTFLSAAKTITFFYSIVRLFEGDGAVRFLSAGSGSLNIKVEKKSVMGCSYSHFSASPEDRRRLSWKLPFDPAVTTLSVEDLLKSLGDNEECIWQYINLKTKIGAIERELSKTTLKINTLEHVVLPSLERDVRRIEDLLSERERQEKFVAKRVARRRRSKQKI